MKRLFNWLRGVFRRDEVVVVIWGVHTAQWMDALAARSRAWAQLPRVRAVFQFASETQSVPDDVRSGRRVVIIPLMEPHILSRPIDGYHALAPSTRAVEVLGNKALFAEYVREQGLGRWSPAVYSSLEDAWFPCVIKRTDWNGGHGVEIAISREHAEGILESVWFKGHAYILQAFVPCATEYAIHCVCLHGRIIWQAAYACDLDRPRVRRAEVRDELHREAITEKQIAGLEAFLRPLDYCGPCTFDCTWNEAGRLTVFEINPRLGGSLMWFNNTDDLAGSLDAIITHAVEG